MLNIWKLSRKSGDCCWKPRSASDNEGKLYENWKTLVKNTEITRVRLCRDFSVKIAFFGLPRLELRDKSKTPRRLRDSNAFPARFRRKIAVLSAKSQKWGYVLFFVMKPYFAYARLGFRHNSKTPRRPHVSNAFSARFRRKIAVFARKQKSKVTLRFFEIKPFFVVSRLDFCDNSKPPRRPRVLIAFPARFRCKIAISDGKTKKWGYVAILRKKSRFSRFPQRKSRQSENSSSPPQSPRTFRQIPPQNRPFPTQKQKWGYVAILRRNCAFFAVPATKITTAFVVSALSAYFPTDFAAESPFPTQKQKSEIMSRFFVEIARLSRSPPRTRRHSDARASRPRFATVPRAISPKNRAHLTKIP